MRSILKTYPNLFNSLGLLLFLLCIRITLHGSLRFTFLFWNLFLALIPLIVAHQIHRTSSRIRSYLYAAVWLLFFPNAAYLITDIVHLDSRSTTDFWLDLVILFGAALMGVAVAVRSLALMEAWYRQVLPRRYCNLVTFGVLLLSGYGIYLGRVERWNSWDILLSPVDLLNNIGYQCIHPIANKEVWLLSSLFAAALGMAYLTLDRQRQNR